MLKYQKKLYLCTRFPIKGSFRDVAQLVAHLVWDQRVARSSRVIPTKKEVQMSSLHLFLFRSISFFLLTRNEDRAISALLICSTSSYTQRKAYSVLPV